jgi:hypothetical protein
MQDADDPNAVIRNAIKDNPPIERRGHYEETQIAELLGSKTGARTHFGKVAQEIERLESRIQKGPGGHIVVAPDVIPALNQILIYFERRLPVHGFKSP